MGLFGSIGAAIGGSKGRNSLSDFMKQITAQNNTATGKPIDNSHSHSNDSSTQQNPGGTPEMQQPVPIIQPNNMANNNYTNSSTQKIGADLFQGEALAAQTAQRRMTGSNPTPLPGEEFGSAIGDNQLETPLMQQKKGKTQTVQNDPKLEKGSDSSYGISGYVNTEKEYKQALQEKNHPNIYKSPVMQANYPHSDSKYKMVNVQDLEDMGRIKSDKIGKYVVNSDEMKTNSSRDTLRLGKNPKHYSGREYKDKDMIDETDFEDFAKNINK